MKLMRRKSYIMNINEKQKWKQVDQANIGLLWFSQMFLPRTEQTNFLSQEKTIHDQIEIESDHVLAISCRPVN